MTWGVTPLNGWVFDSGWRRCRRTVWRARQSNINCCSCIARRVDGTQLRSPSAWLLAITADQARKAVRRMRPNLALIAAPDAAPVSRPDLDARMDVDHAIMSLSDRQRLAVDCYYFADLSIADTAAVMGCSEGTVKSTLSDARSRLRTLLEVTE